MKFISKYSNYRVILRQGIPGNVALGTPTISSISVLFQDNVAEVNDEKYIKMMLEHPRFGDDNSADFIIMKEDELSSAYKIGKGIEPEHNIVEMNHGTNGKAINPKPVIKISDEQKAYMKKIAKEMAMTMYADMVKKAKSKEVGGDVSTPVVNSNIAQEPANITVNSTSPISKSKDNRLTAPLPEEDTKQEIATEDLLDSEQSTGEVVEREVKVGGVEVSNDNGYETVRVEEAQKVATSTKEAKKKPGRPKGSTQNNKK